MVNLLMQQRSSNRLKAKNRALENVGCLMDLKINVQGIYCIKCGYWSRHLGKGQHLENIIPSLNYQLALKIQQLAEAQEKAADLVYQLALAEDFGTPHTDIACSIAWMRNMAVNIDIGRSDWEFLEPALYASASLGCGT
ncbi:hypothetical protein SERLA73DRAFT_149187 [Serpula lacrymans var. lacrymans S7.3]|uniref:Uncharacterized protein n=1 Tax=Serpula lacrymans var. lacrymans (strain S7.3) TaxID=936435 RepID=F8PGC3_SERL3|nr:hypothetical protein SERLA73DRAFT_149187 [Serpula lacrymans var. lacrymans S7.3]